MMRAKAVVLACIFVLVNQRGAREKRAHVLGESRVSP